MAAHHSQILDTHLHLWERRRFRYDWIAAGSALDRDVTLAELDSLFNAACVSGGILIEAANDPAEITWLLEIAAVDPRSWGVIGWVDLEQANSVPIIRQWAQSPRFKGVRLNWLVAREPTHNLSNSFAVLSELGLLVEILPQWAYLPQISACIQAQPHNHFVLEHYGGLPPSSTNFATWKQGIAEIADLPNVTLKLSGYTPPAPEFIETVLQQWGTARLIVGSNYPVYPDYTTLWQHWRTRLSAYAAGVQAALLYGNAQTLYRL